MIPTYAAVTVTFNPDLKVLDRQLASLAGPGIVVAVDNASTTPSSEEVQGLCGVRAVFVANTQNLGLAVALNQGAAEALRRLPDCEYLVFLDQDTEPGPGGVQRLVEATAKLRSADPRIGLTGPLMLDAATGLSHGVHVIRGWRWMRLYPGADESRALGCDSINGSGMVVPVAVFRSLGGFEESFFIDHVDSEYSFRARHAGYPLHILPGVRFAHRMGQRTLRFWLGGWRAWPWRAPQRHYYLFRNAMWLMRRPYVPRMWKMWAVMKLLLTALVHVVADPERLAQLHCMWGGLRAGLRGVAGDRGPRLKSVS